MSYYGNIETIATSGAAGKIFESDLIYACKKAYKSNIVDVINTETDFRDGTDCFWDEIRVDFTMGYSAKNHMIPLDGSYELDIPYLGSVPVKYGIRTGNMSHMFRCPVLVVGCDIPGRVLAKFNDALVSAMKKELDKIMDLAEDLYWAFDDEHPGFLPACDPYFA